MCTVGAEARFFASHEQWKRLFHFQCHKQWWSAAFASQITLVEGILNVFFKSQMRIVESRWRDDALICIRRIFFFHILLKLITGTLLTTSNVLWTNHGVNLRVGANLKTWQKCCLTEHLLHSKVRLVPWIKRWRSSFLVNQSSTIDIETYRKCW